MIEDIRTYLIAQGITTPIYMSQMPDSPDECVCLYQYAGQQEINLAQLEQPGLQVKSRADDYTTAMDNIKAIADILRSVGDEINGNSYIEIGSTKYQRIIPSQSAFSNGLDENNRIEILQNFYITKEY